MTHGTRRRLVFEQFEPRWNGAADTQAAIPPAVLDFDGQLRLGSADQVLFEGNKEELLSYLQDDGVNELLAADNLSIEIEPELAGDNANAQPPATWTREDWEPVIGEVQGAFGVLHSLLDQFFRDEILVQYHLVVTDLAGTPVLSTQPNDQIVLHVEVEDFRGSPLGILGASTSLFYTNQNLEQVGDIRFGSQFDRQQQVGSSAPGRLENIGAQFNGVSARTGRSELFAATFRVTGEGPLVFSTVPLDSSPNLDESVAGDSRLTAVQLAGAASPVPAERIFSLPAILGSYLPAVSYLMPPFPEMEFGLAEIRTERVSNPAWNRIEGSVWRDSWRAISDWGHAFWEVAMTAAIPTPSPKGASVSQAAIRFIDTALGTTPDEWFESGRRIRRLLSTEDDSDLAMARPSSVTVGGRGNASTNDRVWTRAERVRPGVAARPLQLSAFDRRGSRQFLRIEWRSAPMPSESLHRDASAEETVSEDEERLLDIAELLREMPPAAPQPSSP